MKLTRHRRRVILVVISLAVYVLAMTIRPDVADPVLRALTGLAAIGSIAVAMLTALRIARDRGGRPRL